MRKFAPVLLLTLLVASGCAMQPRPARTEVKPGETEIETERDERRPSRSTLRATVQVPEQPKPREPSMRIRVVMPKDSQNKETDQ